MATDTAAIPQKATFRQHVGLTSFEGFTLGLVIAVSPIAYGYRTKIVGCVTAPGGMDNAAFAGYAFYDAIVQKFGLADAAGRGGDAGEADGNSGGESMNGGAGFGNER